MRWGPNLTLPFQFYIFGGGAVVWLFGPHLTLNLPCFLHICCSVGILFFFLVKPRHQILLFFNSWFVVGSLFLTYLPKKHSFQSFSVHFLLVNISSLSTIHVSSTRSLFREASCFYIFTWFLLLVPTLLVFSKHLPNTCHCQNTNCFILVLRCFPLVYFVFVAKHLLGFNLRCAAFSTQPGFSKTSRVSVCLVVHFTHHCLRVSKKNAEQRFLRAAVSKVSSIASLLSGSSAC